MILLTGASGQVGTALAPLLSRRGEVVAAGRDVVDLDRPDAVMAALERLQPEVVVNCAAWTAVDAAEEDEEAATRANGHAVARMADWASANDAWLLTLSTDYVFDGSGTEPLLEDHPTNPVNAYGRGKLAGEDAVRASGAGLVVRTSWVVSATHPNFVGTMLSLLARGIDPRVVDDQHGCPTIAQDLAVALDDLVTGLVSHRPVGTLHLTNRGATTWFGLAQESARLAGFDPSRVRPCGSEEFPTPAARPAWSVLGSGRLEEVGISHMPHWRDSLPAVVAGQMARLAG